MKYRILGRTGYKVSLISLGSGGNSELGQLRGMDDSFVIRLIHKALDWGINYFDTSPIYGRSEELLGKALRGIEKNSFILATKVAASEGAYVAAPEDVRLSLEKSLTKLKVDAIDIAQFHHLLPQEYRYAFNDLLPVMLKMKEQGKIRHIGVTECPPLDFKHEMLAMALKEDVFDTIMVGYNLLGPGAEDYVLPAACKKNIGVVCMIAVRKALSNPAYLESRIKYAKDKGLIAPGALPEKDPLSCLLKGGVDSLPAAGYKFAAAHRAVSTVLTGTGSIEHLEANIRSVLGTPLSEKDIDRIRTIFGKVNESLIN